MTTFSIRRVIADIGRLPSRARRHALMAALLSQTPGAVVTLLANLRGAILPAWTGDAALAATLVLTPLAPFLATCALRAGDAGFTPGFGAYVRQAGLAALALALVLFVARWLFAGLLLWPGAGAAAEATANAILGAALLVVLARGCLWFNELAARSQAPLAALRAAWRLTAASPLRLLAFWVGFVVACWLISLPVTLFVQALATRALAAPAGVISPAQAALLPLWLRLVVPGVFILLNAVMAWLAALSLAAIHRQLTEDNPT